MSKSPSFFFRYQMVDSDAKALYSDIFYSYQKNQVYCHKRSLMMCFSVCLFYSSHKKISVGINLIISNSSFNYQHKWKIFFIYLYSFCLIQSTLFINLLVIDSFSSFFLLLQKNPNLLVFFNNNHCNVGSSMRN